MYALLDKGQIQVGPREYHKGIFNIYLEEKGIAFDLPFSYNGDETIQISESVKLVKVQPFSIPPYNTLTEELAGPFINTSVEPITGNYTVVDRPIAAVKQSLKDSLASNRYIKEIEGVKVTIQGQEVSIETNRGDDRNIWFQSFILLPEGSTQKFKFPKENIWIELTKTDIGTIVQAILSHVQSAFDWESGIANQIESATTKEELEAIDIGNQPSPSPL